MNPASQSRLWKAVLAIGAIASALAIVPQFDGARQWLLERWHSYGTVDLPGTYPGERWTPARGDQLSWLVGDWCYPSLPGFRSHFRIRAGHLERQNQATSPTAFVSDWVAAEVFHSNRDQWRLRYPAIDWPGDYIEFDQTKPAEWRENQRFAQDDGSVKSGKTHLVLSCARCRVSADGVSYSCD